MATLREIVTRLSFTASTAPLDKVAKAVDGIKTRINLLVGIQAVKGLAALTDSFGSMALDLRNAAEAAGLSTDEFQKLGYAAAQSGVSQETMATTLKSLNKRLQDARMGSEQAALSFAQAGVPPEALGSFRNAEDALFGLGSALNHISDPIKRAALSQELLGEQGPKLLGALRKQAGGFAELASSADAAANVLSGKQLDASAAAEQALIGLRQQTGTFASQLASTFAPAVTSAVKGITSWLSKNREFLKTSFKEWAGRAVAAISYLAGEVYQLYLNIDDAITRFRRWGAESGNFARAAAILIPLFKSLASILGSVASVLKTYLGLSLMAAVDMLENLADKVLRVGDTLADFAGAIKALATDRSMASFETAIKSLATVIGAIASAPFRFVTDSVEAMSRAIERLGAAIGGDAWRNSAFGRFFEGVRGGVATLGDALGVNEGPTPTTPGAQPSMPAVNAISDMQARMTPMLPSGMVANQVMAGPAPQASTTVNAPITVNITGNADTKPVIQAVKDGVAEHFDRVMSQATVAGATVQVY